MDRLMEGPLDAKDAAAVGAASADVLKVHIHGLRAAGHVIRTERRQTRGRPGVYHLVSDPPPPFASDYDSMAQSMGLS